MYLPSAEQIDACQCKNKRIYRYPDELIEKMSEQKIAGVPHM